MAPKLVSTDRIPGLDGIRALAILAVMAGHAFVNPATTQAVQGMHRIPKLLFAVAQNGWLGVDLFFVLSGFLITGILLDSKNRPTYFQDFWIRRALRILPLVVLVVAALGVIYRPSPAYVLMSLFFLVDFAPVVHLNGNVGMNPLWSLAVEEQFYLFWPFLVFFLRSRALMIVTLAVIAIEPIVRVFYNDHAGGTLNIIWSRADGLAVGALLAIYVRSPLFSKETTYRWSAIAGVVGVLFLYLFWTNRAPSYGSYITAADLVFGAMVASAVAAGDRCLWILRSPVARFVADTSFCVYLIHRAFLDLAVHLGIGPATTNPFLAAGVQAIFAFSLTFALAALSRRSFELPILNLKKRLAPARASTVDVALAG